MATNELVLHGTVGMDFWGEDYFTAASVREQLAAMNGDIVVRLNSGGGVATEGQAIYTALKDHDGMVTVMVEGVAASAASLLAMAGDEIHMRLGSWMLIHDPASMFTNGRGTADDHQKEAEILNAIGDSYADIYAARAGLTNADAREVMRAESVYTSAQAVDAGFATHVEEATAEEPAAFDYRIYSNAPAQLIAACNDRGAKPRKSAIAAMLAGVPRPNEGEPAMSGKTTKTSDAPAKMDAAKEAEIAAATKAADDNAESGDSSEDDEDEEEMVTTAATAATGQPAATMEQERRRTAAIMSAARVAGVSMAFAQELIMAGDAIEVAQAKIETEWQKKGDQMGPMHGRRTAEVTADARDRFIEGAGKALLMKTRHKDGERNEFTSMTLSELARHSLDLANVNAMSSKMDLVGQAFTIRMDGGSHSTSDFTNILENVASKSMLRGFEETDESFEDWTSVGTLTDFKPSRRVGLDLFPTLGKVGEDGEFTYGTMGDYGESAILATYGRLFKITRQAVINDDLGAFTRIPSGMGRAARRTVGNLAYAVLTANANMSDGNALFSTAHKNLAGSGAAPSVTTFEAAIAAMAIQKDRSDTATALNIRPSLVLAPVALRGAILQVLQSEHDPAKSARAANTVRGVVDPVFDPRLDADSTSAWYFAANPNAADTVEISYLDGESTPFLEQKEGWSVDGTEFKVRIDAAATPLAWEGLYKNPGA